MFAKCLTCLVAAGLGTAAWFAGDHAGEMPTGGNQAGGAGAVFRVDVDTPAPEIDQDGASWATAFDTIQEGIAAAGSGDQVWVAEGTYLEAISFTSLNAGVEVYGGFGGTESLLSERDWENRVTVIDASTADGGGPADHAVYMYYVSGVRIDGFTITGGDANGTGIDEGGGGIHCGFEVEAAVANCTLVGNAAVVGGGIFCCNSSSPTITNCTITGNAASDDGGGICCYYSSSPAIADCLVSGNDANDGGGLFCGESCSPTLTGCTISGNTATYAGGVHCSSSSPSLSNCVISGNSANSGGGVHGFNDAATFTNCVISGNSANSGGGLHCGWSSAPTLTNCTVSGNNAGTDGGGVYCASPASPSLTNCILQGNTQHGLYEGSTDSDALLENCLFHSNLQGDVYDYDTSTTLTGAAAINALAEASGCVDGDPRFQMDSVQAIGGTWTSAPSYNPGTDRTTLTDTAASFAPGALVGRLVNCDTGQRTQALITANTSIAVVVVGDVTGYATIGDPYIVVDYHLMAGSAAWDRGTSGGAPPDDFDGESRPFGSGYDIGADEFLDTDGDALSDWFEMGYDGDPNNYNPYDPATSPTGTDLDCASRDTDGDGAGDGAEIARGTGPAEPGETPAWVCYVDVNVSGGAGNGTSWGDAFTSIEDAIDSSAGGGEIWVAGGTYDESIRMYSGVALYGGFQGTETLLSQRDWTANVTTIDASTAGAGEPADHVVVMDTITDARIDGLTITGGEADGASPGQRGGGIYCNEADATNSIGNCTVIGNSADSNGGGLYCTYSSSPTLADCTFSGNTAGYGGGGIYCSSLALSGCTFGGNSAVYGGGIFCSGSVTLTNCTISGNTADYGGGLHCSSSSPTLTNCTISGNTADYGGGLFCEDSSPTLTNCTISGNTASWRGGGLYCSSSSPALTNCTVSGNTADYGGGLYCSSSSPVLIDCTVSGNQAETGYGGGLYCLSSSSALTNCAVSGNTADSGGGVFSWDSAPILTGCTVSGNAANYVGGGLYCFSSSPTLTNCTISGNTADSGGGVCSWDSSPILTGCTVSGNAANYVGGGLYCCSSSSPELTNCTVSGNTADYGGGIYCSSSSPALTNTIFKDNTNCAVYEADWDADPFVTYCLFDANPNGDYRDRDTSTTLTGAAAINALAEASDNVDGDPMFQMDSAQAVGGTWTAAPTYASGTDRTTLTDTAASFVAGALMGRLLNCDTGQRTQALVTANGTDWVEVAGDVRDHADNGDPYVLVDYHLMYGSAAQDAGTTAGAPLTDFDGDARPVGSGHDIGVDEFLDTDGDGLSDWLEMGYDGDPGGYDPHPSGSDLDHGEADTDQDGVPDGLEVLWGYDPTDSGDTPPTGSVWVDFGFIGTELGTQTQPFNTLHEGVCFVAEADTVNIKTGATQETIHTGKPMTLEAAGGAVTVGAP